ncbi:MAG: hypothetical protein AB7V58_00335 [Solirubrobacterales bacterium]
MIEQARQGATRLALWGAVAVSWIAALALAEAPAKAAVPPGGLTATEYEAEAPPPEAEVRTGTGESEIARLVGGRAIAPAGAPPAVRAVIAAANRIRTKPYLWGGGHGRWWDRGYDCSGAVSFALHAGRLLTTPLTSGSMAGWGAAGAGRWITIYTNAGHVYMVVAGLRWDTAGDEGETGPRWHADTAAAAAGPFVVRHPAGY